MDKTQKQAQVEEMHAKVDSLAAVFALDYRGLNVTDATEFRRQVRESGASYRVVKNTLLKRAVGDTPLASLESHLQGMTGLAYTEHDPVALAKTIHDFMKEVPAIVFKGGILDDKAVDESQFKSLAALPSKEALQSQLLSVLQGPIRNLLGVLQAPARDLILVLKAKANQG